MDIPAHVITNIADGETDVAPDASDYGYLQFPWVAALHRARWWVTRALLLAGVIVILPALWHALAPLVGLPGGTGAWLTRGLHPLTYVCIMALSVAMMLHRPMRKPKAIKRALVWLALGVALFRLSLPLAPPQVSLWVDAMTAMLQPVHPARMGMNSALGFLVISISILLHRARPTLASVLAAFAPLPAVLVITSHLFDAHGYGGAMSPATILSQLLLSLCALSILSHRRTFRTLLSNGMLGRLVRLQLLLGIATPFVVGWVFLHSGGRVDVQILVLTLMVWLGATIVLLMMREHERADYRRRLLERRMLALSALDPLTGVASRRGVKFLTARLLRASQQGRVAVSVLMIDLDNFKSINDRFGHPTGDQVLVRATRLMEGRLRSTDGLARWGGEEFVAVLPGTGKSSAMLVAEALRRLIAEELGQALLPTGEAVTISIGCAEVKLGELGIDAAISRADAALYRAKSAGRNRVFEDPSPSMYTAHPDTAADVSEGRRIDDAG